MEITLETIRSGLNARKDELGMTVQQIVETSGVSRSTVDRILKGKDGYIPNLQTLLDIANAIGYRFEAPDLTAGLPDDDALRQIVVAYEKRLAEKDRIISGKDRWISRLFFCLMLCLLVLLIDVCVRGIGWFP